MLDAVGLPCLDFVIGHILKFVKIANFSYLWPLVPSGTRCKVTEYSETTKIMREKNAEISARVDQMINLLHTNPNKLANALGYGRAQTIYDILNGKAAPSYDFFKRFLASGYAAFINLRWLISGEGSPIIEETYYQSDLPIIKGEMTIEQAKQKLEEIRSKKIAPHNNTENSAQTQPSRDLVSHLETKISEKDKTIGLLHEEIGRLKERIAQLEREKNVSGESSNTAQRELSASTLDL